MSAQIIELRRSPTKPKSTFLLGTVLIEEVAHAELQPGDLIAISLRSTPEHLILTRWLGPFGRDSNGRFVRRGSSSEAFHCDIGLIYEVALIEQGSLRIVGKVLGGRLSNRPYVTPAA